MKEWSYTTGLLIGAGLLLIAGLVLTVLELQEYNRGARPLATPAAVPPEQPAEVKTEEKAEALQPTTVDASDPKSVALAFLKAMGAKDLDEASKYVLEDKRAAFREVMAKQEAPAIPAEPKLDITVEGDSARVSVADAEGLQFEMTRRDGKWWVNM